MSTPTPTNSNQIATRKAFGTALLEIAKSNPNIVVLDAEVGNSTFTEEFQKAYPQRFIECFIAEQNMVSTALGLGIRGKVPFASTFAAFLTRAYDQIRMAQYSRPNLNLVGSHCGVSIGEDGFSQMALEDIAMFRPLLNSVILYPSDSVSTTALVHKMADHYGLHYLRTTRAQTDILYTPQDNFEFGGSKTHKTNDQKPVLTIIGAGITLHEALKAQKALQAQDTIVNVVDLYSIKPVDTKTIFELVSQNQPILVVEDHYKEGGIYSAVCEAVAPVGGVVHSLAVTKMPKSGKPEELLQFMEIDAQAIYKKVLAII
jgi:transketolase